MAAGFLKRGSHGSRPCDVSPMREKEASAIAFQSVKPSVSCAQLFFVGKKFEIEGREREKEKSERCDERRFVLTREHGVCCVGKGHTRILRYVHGSPPCIYIHIYTTVLPLD